MSYREPTQDDRDQTRFEAIWDAIKGWDIARNDGSAGGEGYAGPTGNDVVHIMDAMDSKDGWGNQGETT